MSTIAFCLALWYYIQVGRKRVFTEEQRHERQYSRVRKSLLKSKYGLTPADYEAYRLEQHGRCKICLVHASSTGRQLAVDHDHKTGKIRGLLCINCNTGLGAFRDSIITMVRAARYILKFT